jgi:hypothetical protein
VPGALPASDDGLPLSPETEAALVSLGAELGLPFSAAAPVASGESEAEAVGRPEAFDASWALWPGEGAAPWPDGVVELTGKPAAKFASTPPPEGTEIQARNPTVAVAAATARDRGPFDAPRHQRRKPVKGPSKRVMGDVAPRLADPLRPREQR